MTESTCRRPLGRLLVEMGAISSEDLQHVLGIQRREGRRLGEIVVGRGLASPLVLAAALVRQKESVRRTPATRPAKLFPWKRLGSLLIESRCITEVQLQQTLADQREEGGYLGELLLDRGWITPAELVHALSQQLRPADTGEAIFSVRERVSDQFTTLHVTSSFVAASDYVFEQVLAAREPERLEIIRGREPWHEIVWCFECVRQRTPSAADLLEAFRRLTSEWAAAS